MGKLLRLLATYVLSHVTQTKSAHSPTLLSLRMETQMRRRECVRSAFVIGARSPRETLMLVSVFSATNQVWGWRYVEVVCNLCTLSNVLLMKARTLSCASGVT